MRDHLSEPDFFKLTGFDKTPGYLDKVEDIIESA